MADSLFEQMVNIYTVRDQAEKKNTMREALQIIALAGLNRGGFFEHAAFYDGTCQRVYYGLDRYSEDLDFSLLTQSNGFSLSLYLNTLKDEFYITGLNVTIYEKEKKADSKIQTAFIKIEDISSSIRIKIEVDTNPPLI